MAENDEEKIKELLKEKEKEESLNTCPRCYFVLIGPPIVYGRTNCPNCKYKFDCCE